MASFRTPEGKKEYEEYLATLTPSSPCVLCRKEPVKDFHLWKITSNDFPYGQIAQTHHMLVPKRHATEAELTPEEVAEAATIKKDFINTEYDWIMEAMPKNKSIPNHFHLHLIITK